MKSLMVSPFQVTEDSLLHIRREVALDMVRHDTNAKLRGLLLVRSAKTLSSEMVRARAAL